MFETGFELMFQILSKEWDIASKDVSTVIFFGRESVRLLSNIDTFEKSDGWINECTHVCMNEWIK